MSRYNKYFLRHLLWLDDSFCHYYVQNDFWGRPEILDVEYVIFDWEEDAEYWIAECAEWQRYDTISRLRIFLAEDCLSQYQVHRMNDRQVVRTVARELCMNAHRMVINPKIGWAVQVDSRTRKPVQPIAVEAAPDLDGLLDELKIHLDAMVADRKSQTEQLNAKLAEMNAFQKSWELQKRIFKSGPQYIPLRNAVDTLRAIPDTVKKMGKLLATGGNILETVADSIRAGSTEPIQSEIEQAVAPLVETAEQAKQATAMVQVLLNDDETYDLLYDFGERYVKAMHPMDIAEYGMKAASVIITIIASVAAMIYSGGTSGAGSAGKLLINIKRLRDASPVVDKIYKALKCVAYRLKLPKLKEKVAKAKRKLTKNKGKGGAPEAKTSDKIDNKGKNGYSDDDGSKKTRRKKVEPGGHSDKYNSFKTNADVPQKYSKDPRFDSLSADPDHSGKITSKTRQEAMAGLEAESKGLLKKPIERGPEGIEFYDGNGGPWDVKGPRSAPAGSKWKFNVRKSGDSIINELRKPDFSNKITGAPEKRKVILDSSYMNKADHKALWDYINKEASKEELSRIVEITTDI